MLKQPLRKLDFFVPSIIMALPDAAVGSVVANIVLPLVALVGVALRFLVRVRKHQPLQSDDWTILGALVSSVIS